MYGDRADKEGRATSLFIRASTSAEGFAPGHSRTFGRTGALKVRNYWCSAVPSRCTLRRGSHLSFSTVARCQLRSQGLGAQRT